MTAQNAALTIRQESSVTIQKKAPEKLVCGMILNSSFCINELLMILSTRSRMNTKLLTAMTLSTAVTRTLRIWRTRCANGSFILWESSMSTMMTSTNAAEIAKNINNTPSV